MSNNIIEQIALAADNFITNGRTYTNLRITAGTQVDDIVSKLHEDFLKKWPDKDKSYALDTAEDFFLFSKWNLYKTIYVLNTDFYHALVDTKDTQFHQASLKNIPVNSFFIACPQPKMIGFFVYIEFLEKETFFYVRTVDAVKGSMMHSKKDTLWIDDGQKIGEALSTWFDATRSKRENYDDALENMKAAIQIAYYLSAQNAAIKKIHTPKEKRPKRANGVPLNLRQWDVGYRLGCDYIKAERRQQNLISEKIDITDSRQDKGSSPRAHIRRAHWHHYWSGEGKSKLILKWIEPVWVNGSEDEIIATGHRIL